MVKLVYLCCTFNKLPVVEKFAIIIKILIHVFTFLLSSMKIIIFANIHNEGICTF